MQLILICLTHILSYSVTSVKNTIYNALILNIISKIVKIVSHNLIVEKKAKFAQRDKDRREKMEAKMREEHKRKVEEHRFSRLPKIEI